MPHRREYRLYIVLISVHGLLRSRRPELGRDADTGGQIQYVLDLARALGQAPEVERVDLVTRRIEAPEVEEDYAIAEEPIADGVTLVRLPCGPPRRYLRKELLWPHLDTFADNLVQYLRSGEQAPDLVHGHYADGGYVASQVSGLLDVPMAFTGHSLGRVKLQRLLDQGSTGEAIEKRYRIARRIEAEETALNHAAFVVASTRQEVREQYETYEFYQRRRMLVIPPGVDLERYTPPSGRQEPSAIQERLASFLTHPKKPMVLAISRADPRKNIPTLIRAFGENAELREMANLVIVAGNRDDVREMESGTREVLEEMLYLVDRYDLYGKVAYPKHHTPEEVPELYRIAARTRGVFVNPALTEPFGLTLLEAAASGLPIVATDDGGPQDILDACKNGLLVDPLDPGAIGEALVTALSGRERWRVWSRRGVTRSHRHFSWSGHVKKYLAAVGATVNSEQGRRKKFFGKRSRLITADRIVICDIDNTLTGDRDGLAALMGLLKGAGRQIAFGVATGRSLALTRQALREWRIPTPQVLITSVGTTIHYGPRGIRDYGWEKHIRYRWRRENIREAMSEVPGLKLQGEEGQRPYKISYDVDPEKMPPIPQIRRHLRQTGLQARLVYSHRAYLDVLPIRASKGMALRYFCLHWGLPPERCLVAGDSGNDEEMLTGRTLGVVVGNHDSDLDRLRGQAQIYFASGKHAWGVIEGIRHYDFLGSVRIPPDAENAGHVAVAAS